MWQGIAPWRWGIKQWGSNLFNTRNMNIIVALPWRRETMILFESLLLSQQKRYILWPLKSSQPMCFVCMCVCQGRKSSHQVISPTHLVVFVKQMNDILSDVCKKNSSFLIYLLNIHPSILTPFCNLWGGDSQDAIWLNWL